jgi:hypothetical protein
MLGRLRNRSTGALGQMVGQQMGGGLDTVADQRETANILMQKSESAPDELLKQGGRFLEQLADFARSDDVKTQRVVAKTLATLASHEHFRVNLIQQGEVHRSLLYLAGKSDTRIAAAAAAALESLGVYSHQSLLEIYRACGPEPIRYLCGCSDLRAQRSAASVLASLLSETQ